MGGVGSGRYRDYSKTDTVDQQPGIDLRRWKKAGLVFKEGSEFTDRWKDGSALVKGWFQTDELLIIAYGSPHTNGKAVKQELLIEHQPRKLGGVQSYFLCPGCLKRRTTLFLYEKTLCRECLGLSYRCQRETKFDRASRRADKIRSKLGWEPGCLNGGGLKPPPPNGSGSLHSAAGKP